VALPATTRADIPAEVFELPLVVVVATLMLSKTVIILSKS
jgi:hypothetical protein